MEENKTTETQANTDGGNISVNPPISDATLSPSDIILQLKSEREKNEKVLDEMKKIHSENINLYTRMALGGKSEAGQSVPKEKTAEEIAQEQADNIIKKYWKA